MHKKIVIAFLISLIFSQASIVNSQDKVVDSEMQEKINQAVDKGAKWLVDNWVKKERILEYQQYKESVDDLVLLTLAHAGHKKDDQPIKTILERALSRKEDRPYLVGIQTMALEKLDRRFFQKRIADNGQFLVDEQCRNGQWNERPTPVKFSKPPMQYPAIVAYGKNIDTAKIKPIRLGQSKTGPPAGDNSATAIVIMGLKACMDADVIIPKNTWLLTKRWIEGNQNKDGGWGYGSKEAEGQEQQAAMAPSLMGGAGASAEDMKVMAVTPKTSYGSMTNSALTILAICNFFTQTKADKSKDKITKKGVEWLESNFQIDANPGTTSGYFYYYLYTIERAGRILGVNTFKGSDWYYEGAKYLLEKQNAEGYWKGDNSDRRVKDMGEAPEDTCFAILFLRKATDVLTEGGGRETTVQGEDSELKGKKDTPKQEPKKEEKKKQEPPKQEPAKQEPPKQEPAKQEPAKQEPAKQEPPKADPKDDETKNKLKTTKIDVDFVDKPLMDVISHLRDASGLKIVIETDKDLTKELVTVQMKETALSKILAFILSDKDLDYKVEKGDVKIVDRK